MKKSTFDLIDAINREGLNNSEWGVIEDIESTMDYFGADRDEQLYGRWLYIYLDSNKQYPNLYGLIISQKMDKIIKPKWYKAEEPNIYIVCIQI